MQGVPAARCDDNKGSYAAEWWTWSITLWGDKGKLFTDDIRCVWKALLLLGEYCLRRHSVQQAKGVTGTARNGGRNAPP